jgi:hypothetical protein
MNRISKIFYKIFGNNTSVGFEADSQNPGCENTMSSTKTSSNSDTIYTKTNQMTKTYQWLKGDRASEFVRWGGEIVNDDGINYMVFQDGSRANEELINDFFIEVPSENEPFFVKEFAMPQPSQTSFSHSFPPLEVEKNPPLQRVVQNSPVGEWVSPVSTLLSDSKKTKSTVNVAIVVDIPPIDLMRVLSDSYEDGEKLVLEYLASTISTEDIRRQIAHQIWVQSFTKKKKVKNETV